MLRYKIVMVQVWGDRSHHSAIQAEGAIAKHYGEIARAQQPARLHLAAWCGLCVVLRDQPRPAKLLRGALSIRGKAGSAYVADCNVERRNVAHAPFCASAYGELLVRGFRRGSHSQVLHARSHAARRHTPTNTQRVSAQRTYVDCRRIAVQI